MIFEILDSSWHNVLEAAPWLLFGFAIAGIIHSFMPFAWINFVLRRPGLSSIVNASLIGAPLPLCSCSIIPVVRSLRQKGVPKGAAASFMTSTPEIGIGSFLLTHGLLGPVFAMIRVIASIISAIVVGVLIDSIKDEKTAEGTNSRHDDDLKSCCGSKSTSATPGDSCSHSGGFIDDTPNETIGERIRDAAVFSLYTLPKDLTFVLTFGFLVAGCFAVLLPPEFLTDTISNPFLQILFALLISLPMYICATSSTPIAAVLFYKGLGVGAVLVFLLAGAATNVSTILAAKKEFGSRGAVYYVGGIAIVSLIVGIFFQYYVPLEELRLRGPQTSMPHEHAAPWIENTAAILLVALLLIPSVYDRFMRRGKETAKETAKGTGAGKSCCDGH